MPTWGTGLLWVTGTYLVGSVSFAVLVANRRGIDVRKAGSGNAGATNVARVVGKGAGRAVLLLDMLKGLVPTLAARLWFGPESPWTGAVAVGATVGHVLPIWHGLRGGRGAATAAGALLAAVPLAGVVFAATFLALKKLFRRASVGSMLGVVAGAGTAVALHGQSWPSVAAGALCFIVLVRHAPNMGRLMRGEEPPS